jgi:cation transport regulator ChaC
MAGAFHHDHYDPSDVNEELLTAVLAEHHMSDIWIFGFGSLIHTPGFEYADVKRGYIQGWKRVWWQGSTDHRGTEEYPGRTVTLVEDPRAWTWGVAYKLAGDASQQRETLHYLEWREKQYDHRAYVSLYAEPRGDAEVLLETALCYVATNNLEQNPNYLGPAPAEDIAEQISRAVGPSGPNVDYLFKIRETILEWSAGGSDIEELMALGTAVDRLVSHDRKKE